MTKNYYDAGGISVYKIIKAKTTKEGYLGFLKGNIFKYLCREGLKEDSILDLKKARVYLNKLIKEKEKENDNSKHIHCI